MKQSQRGLKILYCLLYQEQFAPLHETKCVIRAPLLANDMADGRVIIGGVKLGQAN
jgi:hypothetical protein